MPEHEFHFVGNQAGNFESWKPLMETLPMFTVWEKIRCTFMEAADILCSILLGNVILLY
jgi:hypothetical protein